MVLSVASSSLRQRPLWRAAAACLNHRCATGGLDSLLELRSAGLMQPDAGLSDAAACAPRLKLGPLQFCFSSSAVAQETAGGKPAPPEDDNGGVEQGQHARDPAAAPSAAGKASGSDPALPSPHADSDVFEYNGPFSAAVKRVKVLSIASLGITTVASPIIIALQADAAMTLSAKAGIAGTLCGFGVFTTGLLHWFASPYITNLKYSRRTEMVEAHTYTFFLNKRVSRFHISEVQPTDSLSPVSSFKANGKTFFVDADNFADKELLEKLTPLSEDEKAARAAAEQMQKEEEAERARRAAAAIAAADSGER